MITAEQAKELHAWFTRELAAPTILQGVELAETVIDLAAEMAALREAEQRVRALHDDWQKVADGMIARGRGHQPVDLGVYLTGRVDQLAAALDGGAGS